MSSDKIFFKNREVAAYKLLDILPIDSMRLEDWTVIASSYGGFEIAKIVASSLNGKFDIMFSSKIYAPNNEDCEIAVVTEHEEVLIHDELLKSFEISLDYVYSKSKLIFEESIKERVNKFRKGKQIEALENKNVLIVDEGINTGLTIMACIKTAINLKAKSISVAVPVLPTLSISSIEAIADDLYFIKKLDHFVEIDFYYDSLEELSFEDIEKINKEG
ncbi:phosphoribosyltransferase [Aliarcobacter butzleri]|uniref:phosphoribosyltransferase n=1 Tax=Aliarcobacter butzleri TaxID=28197 RepID=UPI000DB63FF9|nr:phosphoribosyltransferase family protein [Aliarcobacter butzleri]MCG3686336.1 ABC transporter [Aliarcobacter butzleri]MDN5062092.1 phosphoribosyltransferase family protein [Aliarcobacter butzleri]PZQ04138.1 MAG: ABC transporter [Aliarcobacter butzleri]